MTSLTNDFLRRYWQSRPTVRHYASVAGHMTLAEKLAWKDLLTRHFNIVGKALKILDVGTGVGALPILLAQMRMNVVGIDWSPDMLDVARQRAAEQLVKARGSCTFVEGEADVLEFSNAEFDAVLAGASLTELLNPQKALHEWRRVLKPGGVLVVIEDDRSSAESRQAAQRHQQRQLKGNPLGKEYAASIERAPLWNADADEIAAAMRLAGYENSSIVYPGGQLMREGTWRFRPYQLGYMLISAEKPGHIPLL